MLGDTGWCSWLTWDCLESCLGRWSDTVNGEESDQALKWLLFPPSRLASTLEERLEKAPLHLDSILCRPETGDSWWSSGRVTWAMRRKELKGRGGIGSTGSPPHLESGSGKLTNLTLAAALFSCTYCESVRNCGWVVQTLHLWIRSEQIQAVLSQFDYLTTIPYYPLRVCSLIWTTRVSGRN